MALKEVALGDFEGTMPGRAFASRRFPRPVFQYYGIDADIQRSEVISKLLDAPTNKGNLPIQNLTVPNLSNAAKNSQSTTHTITTSPLTTNRVTVEFNYFGINIGSNAIFMAIISALSEAATHPASSSLQGPWTSQFRSFPCILVTRPVMPARRKPPVYEWRWAIQALGQATEYVVGRADYRKLRMDIKIDGWRVGMASFVTEERVRGLGKGNASSTA
ncbi:MAG: hypothetical protein Q9166_000845 [cf. Caloplaca sp. 2 TL-2023]